jgi:hypothetical protein
MLLGIGCYMLSVQVDSDIVTMTMVDSATMIGCLHLALIFQGGGMGEG